MKLGFKSHRNVSVLLDFVNPKIGKVGDNACHHRLLQGCMQDLLETGPQKCSRGLSEERTSILWKKNPLLLFEEMRERGISPEPTVVSSIISSCGAESSLDAGTQFHAFAVKFGSCNSILIGSSLISLYSKCGKLDSAYQVFEEMTERNTVSWTAIITGYAQYCEFWTCVNLFNSMRRSKSKPNDFTCVSLLSACTDFASLGIGKSIHSLEIRMGYCSDIHILNALISMYAKCGGIEEARHMFDQMPRKDLISWNSMIFGYARHGLADQSLDLMQEMDEQNVAPDAISFLGALSSCRHACLVERGLRCFHLMVERGIQPELDHYSCVVDLLGHAGLITEALDFIEKMPIPPNAIIWGSLLSSCRVHGNSWIGIRAAERRLLLEPDCAATYVQLANLYANVECWNHVATVRKLMKERGVKTTPGYSWIEIGNVVYRFKAEDKSNAQVIEILVVLDCLADHMKILRWK